LDIENNTNFDAVSSKRKRYTEQQPFNIKHVEENILLQSLTEEVTIDVA